MRNKLRKQDFSQIYIVFAALILLRGAVHDSTPVYKNGNIIVQWKTFDYNVIA